MFNYNVRLTGNINNEVRGGCDAHHLATKSNRKDLSPVQPRCAVEKTIWGKDDV